MSGRVIGGRVEVQHDERSLNLDAIRASLEDAAAVLAEMSGVDTSDGEHETTPFSTHVRVGDNTA